VIATPVAYAIVEGCWEAVGAVDVEDICRMSGAIAAGMVPGEGVICGNA